MQNTKRWQMSQLLHLLGYFLSIVKVFMLNQNLNHQNIVWSDQRAWYDSMSELYLFQVSWHQLWLVTMAMMTDFTHSLSRTMTPRLRCDQEDRDLELDQSLTMTGAVTEVMISALERAALSRFTIIILSTYMTKYFLVVVGSRPGPQQRYQW